MTTLVRVGFFREMPHGEPSDPSLTAARSGEPAPHQEELAAYLAAGHLYIATPNPATDVLDGRTIISAPHYLTDGRYVWPADAAHYVRTYNVRLPPEFVTDVTANGFTVPGSVDISTLRL